MDTIDGIRTFVRGRSTSTCNRGITQFCRVSKLEQNCWKRCVLVSYFTLFIVCFRIDMTHQNKNLRDNTAVRDAALNAMNMKEAKDTGQNYIYFLNRFFTLN